MNYLEAIVERKKQEIDKLKRKKRFKEALKEPGLSLIAEIKRRSPSRGVFKEIADPLLLAKKYVEGGAAALSILTDREGFGGSLRDLQLVAQADLGVPLLRKDFILEPIQLEETVKAGADVTLLIVALLKKRTKELLKNARDLGLEALVEVHNREELDIALEAGAEIIGVNSRNLSTFTVDLETALSLAPLIPNSLVKVAESGIKTVEDAQRVYRAGYDAALVGEALVRAEDPEKLIREMRG